MDKIFFKQLHGILHVYYIVYPLKIITKKQKVPGEVKSCECLLEKAFQK